MLHKNVTVTDGNHIIQSWEVADAAALAALAPIASDIGKIAYQVDTAEFWLLKNNTGPVWSTLNVPGDTDDLAEGTTNLYHTAARVLATVLTGLSTAAGTTVTAAHTVLEAIGFLQKQATDNAANIGTINTTLTNKLKQIICIAVSDETTAITAGTGKVTFRMPFAMTVSAVRASLTTAQASGSTFTVDINEAGASILSTKLTIDNTEKTSTTAAAAPVISDAALADDAEVTIDVDQIGDGTAKGLKVYLIGTIT